MHPCPFGKRALKVTCSATKFTSPGLIDRTFLKLEVDDSVSLSDSIVLCYRGNLKRSCLSSTAVTKTCTWKL